MISWTVPVINSGFPSGPISISQNYFLKFHSKDGACMSAIKIKDLHWRYPSYTSEKNPWILKGIDLDVQDGEFRGITGPSGAGKTTIIN